MRTIREAKTQKIEVQQVHIHKFISNYFICKIFIFKLMQPTDKDPMEWLFMKMFSEIFIKIHFKEIFDI